MNCIILLLLLGCCGGWRYGGGNCCGERNVNCGGRRGSRERCNFKEECGRERSQGDCGCREERGERDRNDCGCAREERERCDVPGMIPPPWQEYPGFSHRDKGDDCD